MGSWGLPGSGLQGQSGSLSYGILSGHVLALPAAAAVLRRTGMKIVISNLKRKWSHRRELTDPGSPRKKRWSWDRNLHLCDWDVCFPMTRGQLKEQDAVVLGGVK